MDVPGHKKGKGLQEFNQALGMDILKYDFNSMKPLDCLNNPVGVIKEAQDLAAEAFNAKESFFMVNGTTCAVQTMILSCCGPNEKIIMPRNVHKSALNALIFTGSIPVYIKPKISLEHGFSTGISYEDVRDTIIKNPDAKAIFLINPTYYGYVSDLEKIVKLAHQNNIPVLVDEAHGAHFRFNSKLPKDAMSCGADMSCVSMHKTGGSLTQSSILLLNSKFINSNHVRNIINLSQTTSASYFLLASLDVARKNLFLNGNEELEKIISLSEYARENINSIEGLYCFSDELIDQNAVFNFDKTKLGINTTGLGLTGFETYDILRDKYDIQMELGDSHNILAILSLGSRQKDMNRLVRALWDISKNKKNNKKQEILLNFEIPKMKISPRESFYLPSKMIELDKSKGKIISESIMSYPPGIPIISAGEEISSHCIEYIKFLKSQNTVISGNHDFKLEFLKVVDI